MEKFKYVTKKIGCLLAVIAYIMGVIGGVGYLIYFGATIIAVCLCAVAVMAGHTFVSIFKYLLSNESVER